MQNIKEKKRFLVVKDGNKIIGTSEIKLGKGRQSHVGELAISIRKEYRNQGLGTKLMAEILKAAERELKPKIIRLSVFLKIKLLKIYTKIWFKEVGKIPKQLERKEN